MWMRNKLRGAQRRAAVWLGSWLLRELPAIAQSTLPRFANQPRNLIIEWPRRINHPEVIFFGDDVWLGPGCFLTAVQAYPTPSLQHPQYRYETQTFTPTIRIGSRVTCSGYLVIGAAQQVSIGDDVLLACNVTILDNLHGHRSVTVPYKYQPLERVAAVSIGAGSWVGQNAVILPGVTIGEMAIVGANSVVTHDVPRRSIVAGAPARVIKIWNDTMNEWQAGEDLERFRFEMGNHPEQDLGARCEPRNHR
jgi:acetyltransferase-like isoleucine patch superfamily enzyme